MEWSRTHQHRRIIAIVVFSIVVATLALIVYNVTKKEFLRGLLIDLELQGPDPMRCGELRDAFVRRLPTHVRSLRNVEVSLEYVHFAEVTESLLCSREVDFVLLSPQGTPWYMYQGEEGKGLERLKNILRDVILNDPKPVLGICGGHQFLALAFGGTVDFIDGALIGTFPERYPGEAIAERGLIELETMQDDAILKGVASHPGRFTVLESHYEEVKTIPEPFVNLARSHMSEVQLMRIPNRLVYGMAFHPERGWDTGTRDESQRYAGKQVLENFLTMVRSFKRSGMMPR